MNTKLATAWTDEAAELAAAAEFQGELEKIAELAGTKPGAAKMAIANLAEKIDPDALPLPDPVCFDSLTEEDFKLPPVLLDGLLFQGGKLMIGAPSKARKSWLLMHLALCVCNGDDWLGIPTKRSPVLFLDLELMPPDARRRFRTVSEAANLRDTSGLHLMNLRAERVSLDRVVRSIPKYCRKHGIGLIIIDPYYKIAMGREENKAEDIAEFLFAVEKIAAEAGAAVAISHHFAKGNASVKESIDRMSGSGVFARDPDALMILTEAECSSKEDPVFVADWTVRSFPPVTPYALRWKFPLWEKDERAGTGLKNAAGRPKKGTPGQIVELLKGHELSAKAWQTLIADETGISRGRFYELRAEAVEKGLVQQRKNGRETLFRVTSPEIQNESENNKWTHKPTNEEG